MDPVVEVRPGMALAAVRRRWRWIVAAALIGLVGGYAASRVLTTSYSATAVMFLNPLTGNPYTPDTSTDRGDQLVALETEAALVSTSAVGQRADEGADGALPADAEDDASVVVPSNSQVLRVSYRANSAELARLGAQSFADAYLGYRQEQTEAAATAQAEQLNAQIGTTQRLLNEASGRLAAAGPDSAGAVVLGQQVQTYASQLAELQGEVAAVTNAPKDPGEVISPATAPSSADGYPASLLVAAGLFGGLAAGILLALWRERGDDRLQEAHDITTLGAGPVLALLPSPRPSGQSTREVADSTAELAGDAAKGFRLLRTAVLGRLPHRSTVAITGTPGVDATGVAAGLGHAAARSGRRVLLIVVDVNGLNLRPFGPGLTNLLDGEQGVHDDDVEDMLMQLGPQLWVLGSGNAPSADDLISRESMIAVLGKLRPRAELIIIAAPAASEAIGQEVAASADATLLVAQFGRTTHEDLLTAREQLSQVHANVLGVAAMARRRGGRTHRLPEFWRASDATRTVSAELTGRRTDEPPALDEATDDRSPFEAHR
jgi:succinoglycan biosynthesis transport protein ExoP